VSASFVYASLFLLGCYHGINPGMGWLFAAALGFQELSSKAVFKAIVPLVLGHLLSVAAIVLVATIAAATLPRPAVHAAAAAILIAYGLYRAIRARHPRWVGMRVGFWGLVLWGLLMSTAHGAGLMLVPFVTPSHAPVDSMSGMPTMAAPHAFGIGTSLLYIGVHTLGYVVTMTAIALIVYKKVGVRFLRTGWLNVDAVWSVALVVTGIIALFM
jgi:hypothetical protein